MTPRVPAVAGTYQSSTAASSDLAMPVPVRRPFAYAALVAAAAAVLLAVTWGASDLALQGIAQGAAWLQTRNDLAARASLSVVLVATAALAFVVAWSRATDPRRPVRVPGGRGTIAVDEVAAWIRDAVEERTDVRGVSIAVQSQGKGVRVAARIAVTADARLQETSKGARAAIEQVLATQVGVPLVADPIVELRYEELRLRPRALENRLEPLTHTDA